MVRIHGLRLAGSVEIEPHGEVILPAQHHSIVEAGECELGSEDLPCVGHYLNLLIKMYKSIIPNSTNQPCRPYLY